MKPYESPRIEIACPCGGHGDDLRITSAWKGKLLIRCRACGHNRTLHLKEIIPPNFTVMDNMTDTFNQLFAAVRGWQKPEARTIQ